MTKSIEISQELRELNSSLPASSHPYVVPQDYFEDFPQAMLARVKTEGLPATEELNLLSPLLASMAKKTPYSLPENYFEENLQDLSWVHQEPSSPVLELAGKQMPYTLPAGYFNSLNRQLTEKTRKPKAPVVSLDRSRWMRVAIAALVTGIVALAGYNYFTEDDGFTVAARKDSLAGQTATVAPDKSVKNELKKVSLKELETFIKNVEVPVNGNSGATGAAAEVNELLKDIPDQELELFLEQIPAATDEASLIY